MDLLFLRSLLRISTLTLAFGCAAGLLAETPAALRNIGPAGERTPTQRDWKKTVLASQEIRVLERIHRDGDFVAYHIAFRSVDIPVTGLLARPHVPNEDTKFPVVILNHGSDFGVDEPYREVAFEFARRGYVVLAPTFRGQAGLEGQSLGHFEFGKGEVIDLLQLTQIARKLEYADTLRMALIGQGFGASVSLLSLERSNVFSCAVLIAPQMISATPQFGYHGVDRLREVLTAMYGNAPSENLLIRELLARDMFRNAGRIRTPLMLMIPEQNPEAELQFQFQEALIRSNVEHRLLRFPDMRGDFLFGRDDGTRHETWRDEQDRGWRELFRFVEDNLQEEWSQK